MREKHLVTSIVITHDMRTAYDVADRLVLLAGGKIAAEGDPESLLRQKNPEILSFAAASGVDVDRPGPRRARTLPSAIRARWAQQGKARSYSGGDQQQRVPVE